MGPAAQACSMLQLRISPMFRRTWIAFRLDLQFRSAVFMFGVDGEPGERPRRFVS